MPRDRRAVIGTAIWTEPSIQALPYAQQHAYLLAYTQPNLNRCGVVPYNLRKWAGFAADLTVRHLRRQYAALHATRHVVLDEDREELFIRTYIGHDGLLTQPLVVAAVVRDWNEVTSPSIRLALLGEIRRLWDTERPQAERAGLLLLLGSDPAHVGIAEDKPAQQDRIRGALGDALSVPMREAIRKGQVNPFPEGPVEGFPKGLPEGLTEGQADPLRARTRAAPAGVAYPDASPGPDANSDAAATGSQDPARGNDHHADEILDQTGPWLTGIRTSLRPTIIEALNRHYPDHAIVAGLRAWQTRDDAKPGLLPHLIHDHGRPDNGTKPSPRQPWCGHCNETTRRREHPDDGTDLGPCPECHPMRVSA